MQNRSFRLIRGFLFIIILMLSVVLINAVVFQKDVVIVPHIAPDLTHLQSPPLIISHQFPFEKTTILLTLPINVSVYEGAKQADKSTMIHGNVSETIWLAETYRAMVNDPAQEEMYSDLLNNIKKTKLSEGLSDDEHLELIAV